MTTPAPFVRTLRATVLSIALAICFTPDSSAQLLGRDPLQGLFRPELRGDTLILKYDLTLIRASCDSILLQLNQRYIPGVDSAPSGASNRSIKLAPSAGDACATGTRWQGETILPDAYRVVPENYSLCLFETNADSGVVHNDLTFHPEGYGRRVTMGLAWFTKSGFDPPVHSDAHGMLLHVEDHIGYCLRDYRLYVGYSFDRSKRYALYNYVRIGVERAFWRRGSWRTFCLASIAYSRARGSRGPDRIAQTSAGVELGIRIDGPFEGLRYSFDTSMDGYHRVDLTMALTAHADGSERAGTMFSLYRGDYADGFGVKLFLEGWGGAKSLKYFNNRPLWHKGLSIVGWIPLSPFIYLMSLAS